LFGKMVSLFYLCIMKSIKVRFNLSRGENYMKWKVQYPDGTSVYYSPTSTQLVMHNCTLKNNRKTADKIMTGQHKTVCAWILCDTIDIKHDSFDAYDTDPNNISVRYNPRVNPYWVLNKITPSDGFKFNRIGSVDYNLFVTQF
jgi:hypothetical protein